MLNQKGFSPLVIFVALALLGIGFYAGLKSQKSIISNVTQLPQNPKQSVNPTVEPIPTGTPAPTQPFSNTADSNAPTFIKVSAPNGGENFKVGDTMHISWTSNNLKRSGSCVVTLAYDNGSKSAAWVPVNTPNGSFDWKLTSESGDHQVKVNMECYDSNSNGYTDQSDNFFTVVN